MDGYAHNQMPYIANPLAYTNGVTAEEYMDSLPALGMQQQQYQSTHPSYSTSNYNGSSTLPNLHNLPLPETNRDFTTGYEDFHFDSVPQPEPQETTHPAQEVLASSLDRDNEILGFHNPTYDFTLLDESLQRTYVQLNARLHGMFFMADETPATPGLYPQMQTPLYGPPELTCYRRNLFQVTGSIKLPRNLRYIVTDQGERKSIVSQEIAVSATESVEGHPVKLISVPYKTPVNNTPPISDDPKSEREPITIPLDISTTQDTDPAYATFPIAWKRLQFRIATANNGRRKELQQHFITRLHLVVTLSTGEKLPIVETRSAAIVVRGRSPRNFQQRRDHAVGNDRSVRRGPNSPIPLLRRATADAIAPASKSSQKRKYHSESPFATSAQYGHRGSDPTSTTSAGYTSAFNSTSAAAPATWSRPSPSASSAPAINTPTFRTPTFPSSKSPPSASPPLPPSTQQPLPHLTTGYSTAPSTPNFASSSLPSNSHSTTSTTNPRTNIDTNPPSNPNRNPNPTTNPTTATTASTQRPRKLRRASDHRPHPYKKPANTQRQLEHDMLYQQMQQHPAQHIPPSTRLSSHISSQQLRQTGGAGVGAEKSLPPAASMYEYFPTFTTSCTGQAYVSTTTAEAYYRPQLQVAPVEMGGPTGVVGVGMGVGVGGGGVGREGWRGGVP